MPANGRWDLIRRLKVKEWSSVTEQEGSKRFTSGGNGDTSTGAWSSKAIRIQWSIKRNHYMYISVSCLECGKLWCVQLYTKHFTCLFIKSLSTHLNSQNLSFSPPTISVWDSRCRYGSLFYLETIVCHFLPLFRLACGRSVEWIALIRYARRREVANDICQIK
jgi:hypothetical protein